MWKYQAMNRQTQIKKYITHLFFQGASGKFFGYLRILFYLTFFYLVYKHPFENFGKAEPLLWDSPLHLDNIISDLPTPETILLLKNSLLAFLLLSAVGFMGRFSMIMSFALGYILLAIPVGFLTSNFQYYLPTVVLGIFAFSKAHDFISIDSLIKYKTFKRDDIHSSEYSWPQNLILFNVVFMYFGAGVGKLRYSGLSWALDGAFQHHLMTAHINFKFRLFDPSIQFFEWLMTHSWSLPLLGISILLLELSSPIAFFYRKALPYFFVIWILFHLSIALFMGITVSNWFLPAFFAIIQICIFSQRSTFASSQQIKKI